MKKCIMLLLSVMVTGFSGAAQAAYHHQGEADAPNFQQAYPDLVGSKLDSCTLCHSGGTYEKSPGSGKFVTVGSCQWCHMTYGYDGSGDITKTINPYGMAYMSAGRSVAAFAAIEGSDSDSDTYTNKQELDALSYPGDATDDPTKTPAPRIVFSLADLEAMTVHSEFLLLNTSRSGDFYAEYSGVPMYDLLVNAHMLEETTSTVSVFAPDGFSYTYDLLPGGKSYYIKGTYPEAVYFYDVTADKANGGWCDYSSRACTGRNNGDVIKVDGGLQMLFAYKVDGAYLEAGFLDEENKLNGEGPFRTVPPQMTVTPPDQLSTAANQDVIWPYNEDEDHNAGFSARTVTAIRVEPLPEGTTDFNWYEGGWDYVDNNKVIIYGNLASGNIQGVVTDQTTGAAIEKALVSTDKGGYSVRTGADGAYVINGVVIGSYSLSVSASGYQGKSQNVTVALDETEVADFSLTTGGGTTCPVETIAGNNSVFLSALRKYRDTVMAQSSIGRKYIGLYYAHAREMTALVAASPNIRNKALKALTALAPAVRGTTVALTTPQMQGITALIAAVKPLASPKLADAIQQFESDLANGVFEK